MSLAALMRTSAKRSPCAQHLRCLACLCQSRMNGGTNIALAIKQAGQLLKNEDADASRIIILLTDGRVDTFQGELQTAST